MQRKYFGWLCGAALLAAVSVPSLAQAPQGGGQAPGGARGGQRRFGMRPLTVADIPVSILNKELKLTDEQKTKISDIHDKLTAQVKENTPAPPAAGEQPDFQKMRDARQKINELNTQATKDIEAVLTDDQKAKLPDLFKGLQVYRSAGIPLEIVNDIKLTDDQKKKITDITDENQKAVAAKFQEAQNGGDRQAVMTAIQQMQKDTQEKIKAVLTDDQKKTLEKYLKDHPQPPTGFGGFGGRRPGAGGQ